MSRHKREAKFVAVFLALLGLYGLFRWSRLITELGEPVSSLPSLLYFAGMSAYLIGGIWLFLHKEWARKLILGLAWTLAGVCAVPTTHLIVSLVQYALSPTDPGARATAVAYAYLGIPSAGLLIWHLWVLAYFTRPHVKAHFVQSRNG